VSNLLPDADADPRASGQLRFRVRSHTEAIATPRGKGEALLQGYRLMTKEPLDQTPGVTEGCAPSRGH